MFEKNSFLTFLSSLTEGIKPLSEEDKSVSRKGYLGFVIKLGKFLEDFSERNLNLKDRL